MIKQGRFLSDAIREFRLRKEAQMNPKKKQPGKVILEPTEGTVYIASRYPSWQAEVLDNLEQLYKVRDYQLFQMLTKCVMGKRQ